MTAIIREQIPTKRQSANRTYWWVDQPHEIYWLEITDRDPDDVGWDIMWAWPNSGVEFVKRYGLLHSVAPQDVVFHYQTDRLGQAIVGWSIASGNVAVVDEPDANSVDCLWWRMPLSFYTRLSVPLTLGALRAREQQILAVQRACVSAMDGKKHRPLYTPFVPYPGHGMRPVQTYFTKLPARVLDLFEEFRDATKAAHDIRQKLIVHSESQPIVRYKTLSGRP